MSKETVLKLLIVTEMFAVCGAVYTGNIFALCGWFLLLVTDVALLAQEKEKNGNNNKQ